MRVLFVANWWYPSRVQPIGGLFIRKHAEAAARYCDVSILHVVDDPQLRSTVREMDSAREGGLTTVRVYHRPCSGPVSTLFRQVRYLKSGLAGCREIAERDGEPDLIHLNVTPSVAILTALRHSFGPIPFVLSEHWSGHLPMTRQHVGFARRIITRWVARHAAAVLPVSHVLEAAMLRSGYEGRYRVLPNVVDTSLFQPSESRDRDSCRAVHVSVLRHEKNVDLLIQAAQRLRSERPGFELHIVGGGPEEEHLRAEAAALGVLDQAVVFHGALDPAGVAEVVGQSDFLVLFSSWENSPCVIPEAMACGVPVVAPRVGGIPEHVFDWSGVLVEAGNQAELEAAMLSMVDHHQSYDCRRIRDYAIATFSYERVGERLLEIYEDAVAVRKTR